MEVSILVAIYIGSVFIYKRPCPSDCLARASSGGTKTCFKLGRGPQAKEVENAGLKDVIAADK